MLKYAKIINKETGLCEIGIGTNYEFYKSIGMEELDVKQSDIDNAWYLAEKCKMKTEEEKQQAERERLDGLFMTRGDVFEAFILAKGLGKAQIRTMIEQAELDEITKALYLNRFDEALNFYRGFPVFDTLGQVVGITSEQLDKFFDTKDYKYLTTCTLTIKPTPTDATVTGAGTYPYGTEVAYTVEAEGYVTKTDTITLVEDTTLEVVLDEDTANSTDISDEVESEEE